MNLASYILPTHLLHIHERISFFFNFLSNYGCIFSKRKK